MLSQGTTVTVDEPGSSTLHTNGRKREKLSVTKGAKDSKTDKQTNNKLGENNFSVPHVCGLS